MSLLENIILHINNKNVLHFILFYVNLQQNDV